MLLSDETLRRELDSGNLVINPSPLTLEAASIDLHLAWIVEEPLRRNIRIDPLQGGSWRQLFTQQIHLDGPYEIHPGNYIIGHTFEWISIPPHLAARVEGRSGLARLGMTVHMTAPHITPGFVGHIALEIFNHSSAIILLTPQTLPVCQLMLESLTEPCQQEYAGRFRSTEPVALFQTRAERREILPIS